MKKKVFICIISIIIIGFLIALICIFNVSFLDSGTLYFDMQDMNAEGVSVTNSFSYDFATNSYKKIEIDGYDETREFHKTSNGFISIAIKYSLKKEDNTYIPNYCIVVSNSNNVKTFETKPFISDLVLHNNSVYYSLDDGSIYKIDLNSGEGIKMGSDLHYVGANETHLISLFKKDDVDTLYISDVNNEKTKVYSASHISNILVSENNLLFSAVDESGNEENYIYNLESQSVKTTKINLNNASCVFETENNLNIVYSKYYLNNDFDTPQCEFTVIKQNNKFMLLKIPKMNYSFVYSYF